MRTGIESERNYSGEKPTYLMSCLVYNGPNAPYTGLWLSNHLKTLLDPTNLPALANHYKLEYALFTDDATLMAITRHPNWMKFVQVCEIHVVKLTWPPGADQFASRYPLLVQMFHQVLNIGLTRKVDAMSVWVADLVFAKHSIPKIIHWLEKGHDAVFNVPIRGAADSTCPILAQMPGAPNDLELFELAYRNLHHLWVASHWNSPLFSKFPYSMLWNSGTGLIAHNFGITPIAFKPHEDLKKVQGVIDADVPALFKNPYWAHDWTDAAVAGIEPLSNGHYPPFLMHQSSPEWVAKWSRQGTLPVQANYLDKPLYYPCKSLVNAPELAAQALEIALDIQKRVHRMMDSFHATEV